MPRDTNQSGVRSWILSDILEWSNLWDGWPEPPIDPPSPKPADLEAGPPRTAEPLNVDLTDEAKKLAWDSLTYPHDPCYVHQRRLGFSARKFEDARAELEAKGFIKCLWFGQTLFLAAVSPLYKAFGIEPPILKRSLSFDHSFATLLAAHLIARMPLVSRVEKELPVGDSGATVDIVAKLRDGTNEAWEITLSAGNVAANAAKCRNSGFSRIHFLCRDTNIRQATWSTLRNSGLEPDLMAKCSVLLFSALLKQQKTMRMV